MFTTAVLLASLFSSAFATVFMTNPVQGTVCNGGQQCNVKWQDDNNAPLLAAWANASFAVYTGNAIQQTMLQLIAPSVNVSATNSLVFTVDPNSGANGDDYFIRAQSLTVMDPKNPTFPLEAFSSKFSMQGMTGTFNATVLAQISGTVTAPIGGPTSAPAASSGASSAQPSGMTTQVVSAAAPTTTPSSSNSTNSSGSTSGAVPLGVTPVTSVAATTLLLVASIFALL